MRLEFDKSLDTNVASYNLYRRLARPARRDNSEYVATIPGSETGYNVPVGYEHYIWFVTTVDADGNESTGTNLVVPSSLTLPPRNLRVVPGITTVPPPPPPTDTTPPSVSITAPTDGSTQTAAFTVTVTATDNVAVAGVKLFIDGNQWQTEITSSPYTWTVNPAGLTNANHTLLAQARDTNNNVASSAQISFTVNNPPVSGDTQAPTVTIDSPANGATVTGNTPILFTATDNVDVDWVQVKVNGQNHGSRNENVTSGVQQAGLSFDASTRSNGQYQITATAADSAGNQANSTVTTVTVNNATVPIPTGFPAADANSTYPIFLDRTYSLPGGQTWIANTATEFQNALNSCVQGDKIQLTAGNTYAGNFILPEKTGSGWIYIYTSALANLPAAGTRINRFSHAQFMPKLSDGGNGQPIIRTAFRAHHYRFVGIEIVTTNVDQSSGVQKMVDIGGNPNLGQGETYPGNVNDQAQFIYFDRCYIHAQLTTVLKRGLYFNGRSLACFDSWFEEMHGGGDTNAIGCITGAGPFCIRNNYFEAAGETIMFGGAPSWIQDLVPSNIEISFNHMFHPLRWKFGHPSYVNAGSSFEPWGLKNGMELKNARFVLIHGNVIENVWIYSQSGQAITFTPRAHGNSSNPAAYTDVGHVTFQYNILRNAASAMNFYGVDDSAVTQRQHNITVRHNLAYNIDSADWNGSGGPTGDGVLMSIGAGPIVAFKFYHNTLIAQRSVMVAHYFDGGALTVNASYKDNIISHAAGFSTNVLNEGQYSGENAITKMLQGGTDFTKNVMFGPFPSGITPSTYYGTYGGTNFFPAAVSNVGFTDAANKNYSLSGSSPYRNAATDGTDIGVNWTDLTTATGGVV
jgi:hypothetical protein